MLFLSLSVYTIFSKEILYKYHVISISCCFYRLVFIQFFVRKSYASTMLLLFYEKKVLVHVTWFLLGQIYILIESLLTHKWKSQFYKMYIYQNSTTYLQLEHGIKNEASHWLDSYCKWFGCIVNTFEGKGTCAPPWGKLTLGRIFDAQLTPQQSWIPGSYKSSVQS